MALANGFPPLLGDPGGPGGGGGGTGPSNKINGEYTGRLLPSFMDHAGTSGELRFLKMEAVSGSLPQDPFLLRLSVEKFISGPIDGAYKENKGIAYVLKVRSKAQADSLRRMTKLADGTSIRINEHDTLNQRKCVVSNYDTIGLTEEYLQSQLSAQGVKEVRRIKRKNAIGELENTPTVILTICGTVIPPHIDFGWNRCKTRNFYPAPMLCFRCWEYGHTGKRCREPHRICGKCSKVHPEDRIVTTAPDLTEEPTVSAGSSNPQSAIERNRTPCLEAAFCKICQSDDHSVSSRKCPAYVRECEIQHIRVDMGISYPQARREYESRQSASSCSTAYTGVVNASKDKEIADLTAKVQKLQSDTKMKERRIEEMERQLQNRGVGDRLETVQQNGTIEDLIRKVTTLTATVEKLEEALVKKDETIKRQKKEIALFRAMETKSECSNVTIPETQSSTETESIIPGTVEQETTEQVAEWVKCNSRKQPEKNCQKSSKNKDNSPAVNSMTDLHGTRNLNTPHALNLPKRNREEESSGDSLSIKAPAIKRSIRARKMKGNQK